jgi:hypothetical protein
MKNSSGFCNTTPLSNALEAVGTASSMKTFVALLLGFLIGCAIGGLAGSSRAVRLGTRQTEDLVNRRVEAGLAMAFDRLLGGSNT